MLEPADPLPLPPHCASCHYDLTGLLTAGRRRCPECGEMLTRAAVALARERSFFRRLRRQLIVVGGLVVLLAALPLIVFKNHALFLAPLVVLLVAPLLPVAIAISCHRRIPED